MNSSLNNLAAAAPVVRPVRRVWVTKGGKVLFAGAAPPLPDTSEKKAWEAFVVDSTTQQAIDGYPRLRGETDFVSGTDQENEVKRLYLAQCRFADGKPDMNTLTQNINVGLWDIHVELPAPQTH